MMRSWLCGIAALCMLALPVADSAAETTLRLNESLGPGSPEEEALNHFKKTVEERTDGEIKIRIFLQDQLGGPQESLENLQTGTLDLYSGALSYYAHLAPEELNTLALLYLFADHDHLRRYLNSDTFEAAHERIKEQGMRFISTEFNGDRGPYRVTVSAKPILSVDDLKGLRMRLWPNEAVIRSWRHLGVVPSVIDWGETYLSIRQGVVESVTSPLALVRPQGFSEVAPYITATKQFPQTWPIAISERTWEKLSPEHQQVLVDAANEATARYAEITYERAEGDIQWMIQENNAVFIRLNTDPFRERMQPLYEEMIEEGFISREAFEAVNELRAAD